MSSFDFKKKHELDISLRYQAIDGKQVDVITVFNTNPKIEEYNLVSLKDVALSFMNEKNQTKP